MGRFRRSWLPCDRILMVPAHVITRYHVVSLFRDARLLAGANFRNAECQCPPALVFWKGVGVTRLHSFTRAWSGAMSGAVPRSARPGPHRFLCYSPAGSHLSGAGAVGQDAAQNASQRDLQTALQGLPGPTAPATS